ncbi:MAG TPA: ABC transporter ATP-binding protein [Pararhizobium sp.]|nr:ABC transporter ATP-binding protein [Pararhizobium sp.]
MSSLTIKDIHKRFDGFEALKGIDLALDHGEFLVLLGPSGCGKSTLLNIVAGLIAPTSGDVRIGERSVVGVHPKNRDIAMVFQSYALYPNMSVARNIGFALEMRGVAKAERMEAVRKAAAMLQIETLLDRRPAALSGGQRQRVAIGRALVRDPAVFLFDEPLSNLDAKLRTEMREELRRLHQMLGATIVYVTHDQIEAMTLATRIAVMKEGRIEQFGPPEEIYNRPANLYVAGFVGSPPMNMLEGKLEQIDGAASVRLSETGQTVRLTEPPDGSGPQSDVILGIRPEALQLIESGDAPVSVTAKVESVELTGPEKLVTATLGRERFIARAEPGAAVSTGEERNFSLDPTRIHLFAPETGRRISA